jgi:hypothetical protein
MSDARATPELHWGWAEQLDIPLGLRTLWRGPGEWVELLALITTVDSSDRVAETDLPSVLSEVGRRFDQVGGAILVRQRDLLWLLEDKDFFTGFDEVWLFHDPPRESRPPGLRTTTDRPFTEVPPADELRAWMLQTDCCLGLGDGAGLNYMCRDPRLALLLEQTNIDS